MRGSQLTKVLLAGVAMFALAAIEISEEMKRQKSQLAPEDEGPDAKMIATQGRVLLAKVAEPGQSLNQYLEQQYLALYLIGRVGEQLTDKELESLAKTLQHFHGQLDTPIDWALVSWYQVVGVAQRIPLRRLLQSSPEATGLGGTPEYIAYALRQPEEGLSFEGYHKDIGALMDW